MLKLIRWLNAKLLQFWRANRMRLAIAGLISSFFVVYFWNDIFISIYPGEAGVLWRRFDDGVVLDKTYGEGLHIIYPWNKMYVYDIRVQEIHTDIEFLDTNGLQIKVVVSVRYFPIRDELPQLHQRIGPDYVDKLVKPEITSAYRYVLGGQTFQVIYAQSEDQLMRNIRNSLAASLRANHVTMESTFLMAVYLPPQIQDAIQKKLVFEQEDESYAYRLSAEEKEKRRKRLEAEGIAAFETIAGVPFLKWEGVKATRALATSENAKVVIIGNDAGSLPVILNADQ